jgi:hypothetical protein
VHCVKYVIIYVLMSLITQRVLQVSVWLLFSPTVLHACSRSAISESCPTACKSDIACSPCITSCSLGISATRPQPQHTFKRSTLDLVSPAVTHYCLKLQLREGREVRSRTVSNNNNPEFNQNFRMLVDDTDSQVKMQCQHIFGGGGVSA